MAHKQLLQNHFGTPQPHPLGTESGYSTIKACRVAAQPLTLDKIRGYHGPQSV